MQILPALESGGVERGTIDIAKALKKADFEPIVVSKGGILVYQLREAGIKHIALPMHSKNPITIYFNNKKLAKLIKEKTELQTNKWVSGISSVNARQHLQLSI